jgi:hypothetical protein
MTSLSGISTPPAFAGDAVDGQDQRAFINLLQALRNTFYTLIYDMGQSEIKIVHHDEAISAFPRDITALWSLTKRQWDQVRIGLSFWCRPRIAHLLAKWYSSNRSKRRSPRIVAGLSGRRDSIWHLGAFSVRICKVLCRQRKRQHFFVSDGVLRMCCEETGRNGPSRRVATGLPDTDCQTGGGLLYYWYPGSHNDTQRT